MKLTLALLSAEPIRAQIIGEGGWWTEQGGGNCYPLDPVDLCGASCEGVFVHERNPLAHRSSFIVLQRAAKEGRNPPSGDD